MYTRSLIPLLALLLLPATSPAQQPLPPGDPNQPILRVEAGGPSSNVTALAFAPEGRKLYAAGFDKVVRVWALGGKAGGWALQPTAFRVPIGPGVRGAINAMALSPDGGLLAVGGLGLFRTGSTFRDVGKVWPID